MLFCILLVVLLLLFLQLGAISLVFALLSAFLKLGLVVALVLTAWIVWRRYRVRRLP
jgi:hypothetical protein